MGLKEVKEELKQQIEKAVEIESEEEKKALEAISGVEETKEEKPNADENKEDNKKDQQQGSEDDGSGSGKTEAKEEVTEKTPTEFAKERKAKKIERERLAEELSAANARIAALEASVKPVVAEREVMADPEPNRATNPMDWADWRIRQQDKKIESLAGWKAEQDTVKARDNLRQRAQEEVQNYEAAVRAANPDYDEVRDYYGRMLMASIKIVNPKIDHKSLVEAVSNRMLTRASELLKDGYENPIEAMYLEAKALGYQPKQKAEVEEKEVKPDMDKVAKFRARNAGTVAAPGSNGEADVSVKSAVGMTNAEFSKLKPEQKKRLFAQLRG